MDHVEEMRLAATLAVHDDFIGRCSAGYPLLAGEDQCRFCGATSDEQCKRKQEAAPTSAE